MNNTMSHSDNEITKKKHNKKLDMYGNHLFKSKERGNICKWVILGQKNNLHPPSSMSERENELRDKLKFLSLKN